MTTSAKIKTIKEAEFQRLCQEAVGKHVYACQSFLVDEMLKNGTFQIDDVENLYEYKCPDCGEAFKPDDNCHEKEGKENTVFICPSCKKEYDSQDDLENEPQEILEWWLVSDNFEYNLKEKGHPFLINDYGTWWGRRCSGQGIEMDGDIRAIVSKWENVKSNNKY